MDEPCSALDPIATLKIEELIEELKQRYTIVIVTHNMQQAARVADTTAFFLARRARRARADRARSSPTPDDSRTEEYVTRQVRLTWLSMDGYASRPALPRTSSRARGRRRSAALDLVVDAARPRRWRRSSTRTSSSRRWSSPTTTALDGRYLEVHQGDPVAARAAGAVAGDLRLVAALLHVIKHIERMGDQCVNIAKLIPLTGHEPPVDEEMLDRDPAHGPRGALGGRAGQAGLRRARRRAGRGPRAPGPRDQPRSTARSSSWRSTSATDADTREWAMHM